MYLRRTCRENRGWNKREKKRNLNDRNIWKHLNFYRYHPSPHAVSYAISILRLFHNKEKKTEQMREFSAKKIVIYGPIWSKSHSKEKTNPRKLETKIHNKHASTKWSSQPFWYINNIIFSFQRRGRFVFRYYFYCWTSFACSSCKSIIVECNV